MADDTWYSVAVPILAFVHGAWRYPCLTVMTRWPHRRGDRHRFGRLVEPLLPAGRQAHGSRPRGVVPGPGEAS